MPSMPSQNKLLVQKGWNMNEGIFFFSGPSVINVVLDNLSQF